jgi:meiotically up-regulated gene 157 (Mug157) protein
MDITNTWKVGDTVGIYTVGVISVAGSMVRCLFRDSDLPCAIIYHVNNNDWIFFIEQHLHLINTIPRILNVKDKDPLFIDAIIASQHIINKIKKNEAEYR